ncbi:hypothetical protein H6P81_011861 [Aristolochia fimbriata]|uniref:Uncharacterized protein n=1 Tax=Aristolochia fimbriata TaxID=158543 RepID=A0AAV7EAB4_ARIFI|nr:hypothetical protein H6P81_011861 [Aristolochia fimbriata]
MEVNECVAEMIKYLANEPSVGLFFVQQHAQNAIPNLVSTKGKIVQNSHEITLETEDLEDSIDMVMSMKECGFTIIDDMNKNIKKTLHAISSSLPKKGLISNKGFGFPISRSSSWSPASSDHSTSELSHVERSRGSYFSTVLNTAKQRAASFRWVPLDSSRNLKDDRSVSVSTIPDTEVEELPLSSEIVNEPSVTSEIRPSQGLSAVPENYEKFKSEQEARLEQWLEDDGR